MAFVRKVVFLVAIVWAGTGSGVFAALSEDRAESCVVINVKHVAIVHSSSQDGSLLRVGQIIWTKRDYRFPLRINMPTSAYSCRCFRRSRYEEVGRAWVLAKDDRKAPSGEWIIEHCQQCSAPHAISRSVSYVCCHQRSAQLLAGFWVEMLNVNYEVSPQLLLRSISQGFIGLPQNHTTENGRHEQKESIDREPFSEPSNRFRLPKPPPWLWPFLLGAACMCGLLSFVLFPESQPAPSTRNRVSLLLYLFGIGLALAAIPAAFMSF